MLPAKDIYTHETIALSKLECENWKVSSEQTINKTDPWAAISSPNFPIQYSLCRIYTLFTLESSPDRPYYMEHIYILQPVWKNGPSTDILFRYSICRSLLKEGLKGDASEMYPIHAIIVTGYNCCWISCILSSLAFQFYFWTDR